MAITRNQTSVSWPTSVYSKSVAAAGFQTSELVTLDATCVDAAITLKADNNSTPASGDTVDFYWAASTGDPDADADSTDEYPTDADNMLPLGTIDTNDTDADKLTVNLPPVPQNGYVYAKNNASSNGITVSAKIEELRAA